MPAPANQCVQSTDRSGLPESRSKHGIAEVWKEVPGILNIKRKKDKKLLSHFSLAAERFYCKWRPRQPRMAKKIKRMGPARAFVLPEKSIVPLRHFAIDVHLDSMIIMTTSWKSAKDLGHHRCCNPKRFSSLNIVNLKHLKREDQPFILTRWQNVSRRAYTQVKDVPVMPLVPFLQSEHLPQ